MKILFILVLFSVATSINAAPPVTIYRAYDLPIGWTGSLTGPDCPANKIAIAANFKVVGGKGNLELSHAAGSIPASVKGPFDLYGPIPLTTALNVRFATMCVDDPYSGRRPQVWPYQIK